MQSVTVLLLGMEGAGKTLLLRRLTHDTKVTKKKQESVQQMSADVVTTAGVELVEVPLGKRATAVFKEMGGCMLPLWPTSYDDCAMLVFVVDAGNPAALAGAALQLHNMLQDSRLQGKPVAVVVNKIDLPARLHQSQVEEMLMIPLLSTSVGLNVDVVPLSAWSGYGTSDLLRWIVLKSGIPGL